MFKKILIANRGEITIITRKALLDDYRDKFANPYNAAELGYVDEVIDPARTRPTLIRALEMCKNKRASNLPRKHGNLPL